MRVFVFLLLLSNVYLAQSQCYDALSFYRQSQIDSFPIAFPGCTSWAGSLEIFAGENVDSMIQLTNVFGNLEISSSDLSDLSGFGNIQTISGDFYIDEDEGAMIDLQGLNRLKTIGGDFEIEDCPTIESLAGLDSLQIIGGGLDIRGNPKLADLSGLIRIKFVEDIRLLGNGQLEDLSGLDSLTTVNGDFELANNFGLKSLEGLNSLRWIDGDFTVEANEALLEVEALASLELVNGELVILNNDVLQSLSGLDSLDGAAIPFLTIGLNSALSFCSVAGICEQIDIDPLNSSIYSNAEGCDNRTQVIEGCETTPSDTTTTGLGLITGNETNFFPNPVSEIIYADAPVNLQYNLFDIKGRLIQSGYMQQQLDLTEIPSGLYYLRFLQSERNAVKFVKY